MAKGRKQQKVRVNLRLSVEAHQLLLEFAGSERRMGAWLEQKLTDLAAEKRREARIQAIGHLRMAKDYLDEFFATPPPESPPADTEDED